MYSSSGDHNGTYAKSQRKKHLLNGEPKIMPSREKWIDGASGMYSASPDHNGTYLQGQSKKQLLHAKPPNMSWRQKWNDQVESMRDENVINDEVVSMEIDYPSVAVLGIKRGRDYYYD